MEDKIKRVNEGIQKLIKKENVTNVVTVSDKQSPPQFVIKKANEDDVVIRGYDDMEKFIKSCT